MSTYAEQRKKLRSRQNNGQIAIQKPLHIGSSSCRDIVIKYMGNGTLQLALPKAKKICVK